MTPKEKAIELVDKFIDYVNCWDDETADHNYTQAYKYAKQCALIAVEEIIRYHPVNPRKYSEFETTFDMVSKAYIFWEEVKQEIEKL